VEPILGHIQNGGKSAMAMSFSGSTVLLIGGAQNIGRAVALEFARRGADVAVADRDEAGANETAELVAGLGRKSVGLACDVTDVASLAAAAEVAEAALGPIDVLMNNAGILSGGNPEDIPFEAWRQMMDVNYFGMVRAIELFLPKMLARGSGHIVNTASFAGMYPFAASRIHYAASKAAVLSMSENLALYCLPRGIGVSCLCPGPVMTTSVQGMKHYSEDYTMRAPGSYLTVKSQEETATILADGMEAGQIVIPTHAEVWDILQKRAPNYDAFIHAKLAEFEAGDSGRPQVPEHFLRGR
jgi:NAD(P)-dependent dehydrogenase (short-subunit alcohol dehydrogenase family)